MTAKAIPADPLRDLLPHIEAWCTANGVAFLPASSTDIGQCPTIHYAADAADSWQSFLVGIKEAGAAYLASEYDELSDTELAEAEERLADPDSDHDLAEAEEALTRARRHSRQVGLLALTAFLGPGTVAVRWTRQEDWYRRFMEALFPADDYEESHLHTIPSRSAIDPELLESLAKEAANSQVFQEAPHAQKRFALERALASRVPQDESHAWQVFRRAMSIWEVDVRPVQDAAFRVKALELQQRGLKRVQVASELGISMRRLRDILGSK